MENSARMPERVFQYTIKCPLCGGEIIVSEYKYTIPYYGDILISSGTCPRCNYVYRNVDQLSGAEPRKIIYRVESPDDVNAIVIKSAYAKIEIPELGLIVEPGVYSQGYITTIEGLILDFINVVDSLYKEKELDSTRYTEILQKLNKARNGELKFTIIIYDYMGISDIVSDKTTREKLKTEEEHRESKAAS